MVKARSIVKEIHKGGLFLCCLQDNETHTFFAHLCGKMRKMRITLCVGDDVSVELSPYDLRRGRVTWRYS